MSAYISEEFKTNIKVANYADTPFENCDRWFKSKFLLAYDEESGKNERLVCIFLVQANDVSRGFFDTRNQQKHNG
jgi:hypothetical protein